jgi:hypothetical protein
VILHISRTDRLELPAVEDGEVLERVAAARQRRRPDPQAIPLEPCLGELGERLRTGRVERAERDAPVDLVTQAFGIALSRADRLPAVAGVGERLLHGP